MKSTFILEHLVRLVQTACAADAVLSEQRLKLGLGKKSLTLSLLTARRMKNSEISLLIQLSARQRHV